MAADWSPITRELGLWRQEGLALKLWWRDDDAITATPELETLRSLSVRLGMDIHLAVIPKLADARLVAVCAETPNFVPVVHGWAHENYAVEGQKKAEFGAPRSDLESDAAAGLARLDTLFGHRILPLFVPPWNRVTPELLPKLPDLGYAAVSTYTPRAGVFAAPGLVQINTHLDPVNWRGGRRLMDEDALIAQLAKLLQDRRSGKTDNSEPLGLLTHHLIHDEATWGFVERCLGQLLDGGAAPEKVLNIRGHQA